MNALDDFDAVIRAQTKAHHEREAERARHEHEAREREARCNTKIARCYSRCLGYMPVEYLVPHREAIVEAREALNDALAKIDALTERRAA